MDVPLHAPTTTAAGWFSSPISYEDLEDAYRHFDLQVPDDFTEHPDQYILDCFKARQTNSGPIAAQQSREALYKIGLATGRWSLVEVSKPIEEDTGSEVARSASSTRRPVPWYTKDSRNDTARFEAVRDVLVGAGTGEWDPPYFHYLNFNDLNPWDSVDDPDPFGDYFSASPNGAAHISPIAYSWFEKDTRGTASRFPAVCDILLQIKDCECAMAALEEGLARVGHPYTTDMCSARENVIVELQKLQCHLDEATASMPFAEAFRKDQAYQTCSDALALPELLEHILSFISVKDILSVQQASKTCYEIVSTSPRLQYRMGLRADFDGFHVLPLGRPAESRYPRRGYPGSCDPGLQYPRFACFSSHNLSNVAWDTTCLGRLCMQRLPPANFTEASVTVTIEADAVGRLPTIGSRYRAMLVSQPPIEQMTIGLTWWPSIGGRRTSRSHEMFPPFNSQDLPTVTVRGAGLTLGKLWDAAEHLLRTHGIDHASQPFDPRKERDLYEVKFEGTVRLRYDEPVVCPDKSIVYGRPFEQQGMDAQAKSEEQIIHEKYLKRAAKDWASHKSRVEAYSRAMRNSRMQDPRNPTEDELKKTWSAVREAIYEIANGNEGVVGE
ncbi:ubiquitin-specific protease ubp2 [Elasticomyces elasticus]|nr:ubiquitin-specific protease ubp2 [Elasticomyces elasticus]